MFRKLMKLAHSGFKSTHLIRLIGQNQTLLIMSAREHEENSLAVGADFGLCHPS